ncbi:S26 family signal peptidase [Streptosporangium canum]|uniref:S26 family signal peptidase n=1 Tax=Streptosporangium canum TaxID=324952 RepID=UPI0036C4EAD0
MAERRTRTSRAGLWVFLAGSAAIAAACFWARARLGVADIVGQSMEPFLNSGDRVLFRRGKLTIRRGDVIVLRSPVPGSHDPIIIKRVAAVQGDAISAEMGHGVASVPADHLVVLGDNGRSSLDSRQFGPVSTEYLIGKTIRRMRRA